jgi:hypothetical protein
MHDLADPLDAALGVLRLAVPNAPVKRSTSPTIIVFAVTRSGLSVDKFAAATFVCCKRIAMWNQSKIGSFVAPTLTRTVRRPGQPSVKAVTLGCRSAPRFPGFAGSAR